jgi:HSP20 family molecular chaperone IbpA
MKTSKNFMDLGTIFDEIFEAAQDFQDEFHRNFNPWRNGFSGGAYTRSNPFEENIDYYPNYSYPPMNIYMKSDRSMAFEFALAGFDEKDINLSFQGDYMVFQAKLGAELAERDVSPGAETASDEGFCEKGAGADNFRYFKRRLKLKDIEKQKYFVPLDKYSQEKVKAVYRNGILKVTVPPKDEPDQSDGIKIDIVKESV